MCRGGGSVCVGVVVVLVLGVRGVVVKGRVAVLFGWWDGGGSG